MRTISVKELKAGDVFQSVRTGNRAATGGTVEKVGRANLFFGGDYMGRPLTGIKLPLANLVGGKVLRDGVVYQVVAENQPSDAMQQAEPASRVVYEPNWTNYAIIGHAASVADAMDHFYKHDRLNRPGGTRERLIADREADQVAAGFACIASHHDSVTGRAIYVRRSTSGFDVYGDAGR